jgi:endonuclease G
MRIRQDWYDASERRALASGIGAMAARATREAPPPQLTAKAIIRRTTFLSANGNVPSPTELERIMGGNDLVDEFYLQRGLTAASPICRIVLRSPGGRERGYATGFLVAPRILLTNWHVLPTVAEADNAIAEFNYRLDYRGNPAASTRFLLRPDQFHYAYRDLDFALVCVDGNPVSGTAPLASFGYHRLLAADGKISEREWITIIQHPSGGMRQFAIRDNQLLAKRDDGYLWYASDTAPGSSGAPAFNDSFQVVALHHMGIARKSDGLYVLRDGRKVPSIDGLDDTEIVWEANEGVRVSFICKTIHDGLPHDNPFYVELCRAMEQGGVMAMAQPVSVGASGGASGEAPPPTGPGGGAAQVITIAGQGGPSGSRELVVPLELRITLPAGDAAPRPTSSTDDSATVPGAAFEALVEPFIDAHYENRRGYDPRFLGIAVPLPKVQRSLLARAGDDDDFIRYENFSVALHRTRRLALVTASNVDASPAAKEPETGHDYSRKGLTGLDKNDEELWVTDPRIPEQFQVPDVFYTKDGTAFDKGHIVRREDVCWGQTYAQVRRANGDTFHTTNCSPQIKSFNRSVLGETNWGDLENVVLAAARSERLSLFAGPVLAADDPKFVGRDRRGELTLQIPRRFWKVAVAKLRGKPACFAFLLEQDLSHLPPGVEFDVDPKWRSSMIRLAELEKLLTGVRFAASLKRADQFVTATGKRMRAAVQTSA